MSNEDIRKASNAYIIQISAIVIVLSCIVYCLNAIGMLDLSYRIPMIVSGVYLLIIGEAISLIWRRIATKAPDALPTFFMAVSGFRMLLALFTLFGCYLAVGRNGMKPYIILFMVYYIISLAHHSLFFARINNMK